MRLDEPFCDVEPEAEAAPLGARPLRLEVAIEEPGQLLG
jgi:hypothetical protein